MLWTEEDLRQLRQEGPEPADRTAAPEKPRWEREIRQGMYSSRDPGALFWGIVEPCLTPEERRIWGTLPS
jgi:hypothetical protein